MKTGNSSYPVIALVANRYSDFRRPVAEHLTRILAPLGYGLVCIVGGDLQSGDSQSSPTLKTCNAIYEEAAKLNIKGYLFISVIMGHDAEPEQIQNLIRKFLSFPVVSYGLDVPDVPSIAIDNEQGMRQVMQHMLRDDRRRRFVFMRGYPQMPDSCLREATFRSELLKTGREVDEELIITGNFLTADSFSAMEALLAKTKDFDAVVAANDVMAISVIQALNKKGIRVPEDVIVSGFDDHPAAAVNLPPITTVRYSFEENATVAIHALLSLIEGTSSTADCLKLPSASAELIVRDSSLSSFAESRFGIPAEHLSAGSAMTLSEATDTRQFDVQRLRQDLIDCLNDGQGPVSLDVSKIADCLFDVLLHVSEEAYRHILSSLLSVHTNPELSSWWARLPYSVQGVLVRNSYMPTSPAAQQMLSSLFMQVQSAVRLVSEKQQFDTIKYLQLQDRLHIRLSSCNTTYDIFDALGVVLVELGVHRAYVVLYDSPTRLPAATGRVHYSFPDADRTFVSQPFATEEILPKQYAKTLTSGLLVLSPLCASLENFGYLLIDPTGIAPLNIEDLCNTLSNALRSYHRTSELEAQANTLVKTNNDLSVLANFDPLTGLCNWARFSRLLQTSFECSSKVRRGAQILLLDIDEFKMVNDSLGHGVGDKLLINVAKRLRTQVRGLETVARLGGDEFAICVSHTDVSMLANRILASLNQTFVLDSYKISLTASVGIASFPEHGSTPDEVMKHADTAMYHAKASGKNRYSIFHPSMNQEAKLRISIDQAMRQGLRDDEFTVHYQPRVSLLTGLVVSFEALVRWNPTDASIDQSYTKPDVFIGLAEKTGFVTDIDEYVFEKACEKLKSWHSQGYLVSLSVNLSIARLQQDNIVKSIMARLEHHDIEPHYVEFEITEHAAMADVNRNILTLVELQKHGVRVSIDDFGTGYSSLSYLKQLPVSSLKIDRSFLQSIQSSDSTDSADAAIVKAIVALSKSMKYTVVAEGVELDAQHDFLCDLECDEAQGFLYSKGLDGRAADQFLIDQSESCSNQIA